MIKSLCVWVGVWVDVRACVWEMHVHTPVSMCMCACVGVGLCMWAYVHVYVHLCMYMCMCECMLTHKLGHLRVDIFMCVGVWM